MTNTAEAPQFSGETQAGQEDILAKIQSLDGEDLIEFASEETSADIPLDIQTEQADKLLEKLLAAVEDVANRREEEAGTKERFKPDYYKQLVTDEMGRIFSQMRLLEPRAHVDNKDAIQDQLLLHATELAGQGQNLESVSALMPYLGNRISAIKSDVACRSLGNLVWADKADLGPEERETVDAIRDDLLGWLVYKGESVASYLEQTLETNRNPVSRAKTLEMARFIFRRSTDENWARSIRSKIQAAVEHLASNEPIYLLRKRAATLSAEMAEGYGPNPADRKFNAWQSRSRQSAPDIPPSPATVALPLAPGLVGIYDRYGNIEEYVEADSGQHHDLKEINPFVPRPDLSDREKEDRAVLNQDFQFLLSLPMREQVEADFGLDLATLDLTTQQYFLNFIKEKPLHEVEHLADVYKYQWADSPGAEKTRRDFMTSFLSLDHGTEMGDKILAIAKAEGADKIFARYAEIVAIAEDTRTNPAKTLASKIEIDMETAEQIVVKLLENGKNLLSRYAEKPAGPGQVAKELEKIKAETLVFANTVKTLRQKGRQIELEQFNKYKLDLYDGQPIPGQDKQTMKETALSNWASYPEAFRKKVFAEFEQALDQPEGKRFYLLRYDGDIIAFVRFDRQDAGHIHAASLNVLPELQGHEIGRIIQEEILSIEAKSNIVKAEALPERQVATMYIGEGGFIGTNIVSDTGVQLLEINRNDAVNSNYRCFGWSYDQAASTYRDNNYRIGSEPIVLKFNLGQDFDQFIAACLELFGQNYVMTAYPHSADDPDERLVVFEKALEPAATYVPNDESLSLVA